MEGKFIVDRWHPEGKLIFFKEGTDIGTEVDYTCVDKVIEVLKGKSFMESQDILNYAEVKLRAVAVVP